jgi:hypothetical protein
MRKVLLALFFVFSSAIPLFAQVDTAWVRVYRGGETNWDGAPYIAVDSLGNVYIAGTSKDSITYYDFLTVKYDSFGNQIWLAKYDGPGDTNAALRQYPFIRSMQCDPITNNGDYIRDLTIDHHGNICVTGSSANIITERSAESRIAFYNNVDYLTIKYRPNGDTAWVRRYDGPKGGNDRAVAIAADGSDNIYVVGIIPQSEDYTNDDYATVKYYPNGNVAWVRIYDGPRSDWDWAEALAVDGSGNVYETGTSYRSHNALDLDRSSYATIKYYPNGDTAWLRTYDGQDDGNYVAKDIAVDDSANVYVVGSKFSNEGDSCVAIKYYPNGDIAWVRNYNKYYPSAVITDDHGNLYLTGRGGSMDIDAKGNQLWTDKSFDGVALALDAYRNLYVTGSDKTVKYNMEGKQLWVGSWGGNNIALDNYGNVYVTGSSHNGTNLSYVTIKYIQNK